MWNITNQQAATDHKFISENNEAKYMLFLKYVRKLHL